MELQNLFFFLFPNFQHRYRGIYPNFNSKGTMNVWRREAETNIPALDILFIYL